MKNGEVGHRRDALIGSKKLRWYCLKKNMVVVNTDEKWQTGCEELRSASSSAVRVLGDIVPSNKITIFFQDARSMLYTRRRECCSRFDVVTSGHFSRISHFNLLA